MLSDALQGQALLRVCGQDPPDQVCNLSFGGHSAMGSECLMAGLDSARPPYSQVLDSVLVDSDRTAPLD